MNDFDAILVYLCTSAIWLNLDSSFPESLVLESGSPQRRVNMISVEITCLKLRCHTAGPCRLVLSAPMCIWELSFLVAIQWLLHDIIMNIHNISLYVPNASV